MSNHYKNHRLVINNIKPAVDNSNDKRNHKIIKTVTERARYTDAVRNFQISELQKDNDRMIKRIGNTTSVYKDKGLKINPENEQSKSKSRSMSKNTLKSTSSEKSFSSNFRRRTLRQK